MLLVISPLRKSLFSYGVPAIMAVTLHGALALGLWIAHGAQANAPQILHSFEMVELPSSAAVVERLEPTPEPEPAPEPDKQPEPEPQILATPAPTPEPAPAPAPALAPKPIAKPVPKPVAKPVAPPQPKAAFVQQDAAQAPATAYVAPSQHAAYLSNPKPAYPSMARKRGMEGRVVLRVQVRPDGTVKDAFIEQSTGYALLDRAARAAVLRWRFAPATRANVAVEGEVLVPFDFRLTTG